MLREILLILCKLFFVAFDCTLILFIKDTQIFSTSIRTSIITNFADSIYKEQG